MDVYKLVFARRMLRKLGQAARDKCHGCKIDDPSQSNHEVCFLPTTEKVDIVFEDLLELNDLDKEFDKYLEIYKEDMKEEFITTVKVMMKLMVTLNQ